MSPDFESNAESSEANSHPYIYIQNNNFTQNMAYFAGNALYIAHTVKRVTDFHDYLYMCGAGVHIDQNLFYGNIGTKRHNGGAIVNRCFIYFEDDDEWVSTN